MNSSTQLQRNERPTDHAITSGKNYVVIGQLFF